MLSLLAHPLDLMLVSTFFLTMTLNPLGHSQLLPSTVLPWGNSGPGPPPKVLVPSELHPHIVGLCFEQKQTSLLLKTSHLFYVSDRSIARHVKLPNGRFNITAVLCFKLENSQTHHLSVKLRLALSATWNFLELLLFISTLGNSYSSEKHSKPFKIGRSFCSSFKRKKMIPLCLFSFFFFAELSKIL